MNNSALFDIIFPDNIYEYKIVADRMDPLNDIENVSQDNSNEIYNKKENRFGRWLLPAVTVLVVIGLFIFGVNEYRNFTKIYYDYIEPPIQISLSDAETILRSLDQGDASLTKMASYEVKAVVKSKKNYKDEMYPLVPMDFVLAWDLLNKKAVDEHIKYWQKNRWYYYECDSDSIVDLTFVQNNSSNHHLIPATAKVWDQLRKVRQNEYIELKGFLVNINYNGRALNTSLSRTDQGAGACEIMYVTKVTADN
jgi:hypothetical protein